MRLATLEDIPVRGNRRYPWPDWADGEWRVAEPGVDFDKVSAFRVALNGWCANDGCRMRDQGSYFRYETRMRDDGSLAFRIVKREPRRG